MAGDCAVKSEACDILASQYYAYAGSAFSVGSISAGTTKTTYKT